MEIEYIEYHKYYYVYLTNGIKKTDVKHGWDCHIVIVSPKDFPTLLDLIKDVFPNSCILCSYPCQLGNTVEQFIENGLYAVRRGIDIRFLRHEDLSFYRILRHREPVETRNFQSICREILPESYYKKETEEQRKLNSYYLAYICNNFKVLGGKLSSYDIESDLGISETTFWKYRKEIKNMLANGQIYYLDNLVINEIYNTPKGKEQQIKEEEVYLLYNPYFIIDDTTIKTS